MSITAHLSSESDKGCAFQIVACLLNCGEGMSADLLPNMFVLTASYDM